MLLFSTKTNKKLYIRTQRGKYNLKYPVKNNSTNSALKFLTLTKQLN